MLRGRHNPVLLGNGLPKCFNRENAPKFRSLDDVHFESGQSGAARLDHVNNQFR